MNATITKVQIFHTVWPQVLLEVRSHKTLFILRIQIFKNYLLSISTYNICNIQSKLQRYYSIYDDVIVIVMFEI